MTRSERAIYTPQGMNARRLEAFIIEKMPPDRWLSVNQICRLVRKPEDRTRPRLNRLLRDGKIERKREQGVHGPSIYSGGVREHGASRRAQLLTLLLN